MLQIGVLARQGLFTVCGNRALGPSEEEGSSCGDVGLQLVHILREGFVVACGYQQGIVGKILPFHGIDVHVAVGRSGVEAYAFVGAGMSVDGAEGEELIAKNIGNLVRE